MTNLPTINDVRRRHARERKAMLSRQANELRRLRQARKKAASKKAAAKKAPAKKAAAKKAPAKKASAKKASAKKTPAKKTPAKKATAKKVPAKKATAKKTPAKKVPQDVQLLVSAVAQYGRGALVPVRILRMLLGLPHSQFDVAAKSALASGQLIAHHHDHPESLSVSDRLAMLRVGRTYYIGMALPT